MNRKLVYKHTPDGIACSGSSVISGEWLGQPKPLTEGQEIMALQRAVRKRSYLLQYSRDGQPIRRGQ